MKNDGRISKYKMDQREITGQKEKSRWRRDFPQPSTLLYNGYRVPFPEVKRPGRGVDHPNPSKLELYEREELYLYSLGLHGLLQGELLPFRCRSTVLGKLTIKFPCNIPVLRYSLWLN
jgi:hypothetical protein